jgi:hypothetical protein
VIAAPSVRGYRSRFMRLSGIVAYVVAVLSAPAATGLLSFALGRLLWQRPVQVVALAALGAALVSSGLVPLRLPQSTWRVPKSWSRFGPTAFAALFGTVLGLGFLTAISSIGYYVLLLWAATSPTWSDVWPVFVAFGAGRAIPLVLAAMLAGEQEGRLQGVLQGIRSMVPAMVYLEIGLLVAVSVDIFASTWTPS